MARQQQIFHYQMMNNEVISVAGGENLYAYSLGAAAGVTIEPLPEIKKKPLHDDDKVIACNNQLPQPPAYSPPQYQLPPPAHHDPEVNAFDNAAYNNMVELEEKKVPLDGIVVSPSPVDLSVFNEAFGTNLSSLDDPSRVHAEELDNKVNTTRGDD